MTDNCGMNQPSSSDPSFHCHDTIISDDEDHTRKIDNGDRVYRHSRSSNKSSSDHRSMALADKRARSVLWMSVSVCLFFMICEVIGGLWAHSLAIITDAAHLLTDLASMLISLFSLYLAGRPASQRMSFGWHRAEVLGAFVSVFMIWIVTGILVFLAIQRIATGNYEIEPSVMAITATIGVLVNIFMGLLLFIGGGIGHHHHHGHGHSHGYDKGNGRSKTAHDLKKRSQNPTTHLQPPSFPGVPSSSVIMTNSSDANNRVQSSSGIVRFDMLEEGICGSTLQEQQKPLKRTLGVQNRRDGYEEEGYYNHGCGVDRDSSSDSEGSTDAQRQDKGDGFAGDFHNKRKRENFRQVSRSINDDQRETLLTPSTSEQQSRREKQRHNRKAASDTESTGRNPPSIVKSAEYQPKVHHPPNINIRAAFIHVLGDLLQSVAVLIAGLLILIDPRLAIADPICTLIFSVIVLSTTVYIVRDALVVLLEGRPSTIDFRLVFDALENINGVIKVHDLRIWALTMHKIAISVHLEIEPRGDSQQILRETTRMLRRDFNVHESTVQIETYHPESLNCFQCFVPQS